MQEQHIVTEIELLDILKTRLDKIIKPEDSKAHFFSRRINLDEVSMLYLVSILEEKHGIKFDESDFTTCDFFCVDGLIQHLCDKVLGKQP